MFKNLHKDTFGLSLSVVCFWALFLIIRCILYFFDETTTGSFGEIVFEILLSVLVYGSLVFLFVVPLAIIISLIVHAIKDKETESFFRLFSLGVIVLNIGFTLLEYNMLECFF